MRRLWLINIDEAAHADDIQYAAFAVPKAVTFVRKYLFFVQPGDAILSPCDVGEDFLSYVSSINGLGKSSGWFFRVKPAGKPYSLAGSILADRRLMDRLRKMARSKDWALEPYLESPQILELAKATGIPTRRSDPDKILDGTLLKLNDKGHFKALAKMLGIDTVPGYLASDAPSLAAAIRQISHENNDRIFLRKTRYTGGFGNLCGRREELLKKLPSWYNQGEVLVEHWLPFEETVGSLVTLNARAARFWGIDRQLLGKGHWAGFSYPHPDAYLTSRIRAMSLRLAVEIRKRNARGDLNLDWGILRDRDGSPRPIALECNFRHNSFGHVMHFAQRYFASALSKPCILYRGDFPLAKKVSAFPALTKALGRIKLDEEPVFIHEPGKRRGAVVMSPPEDGRCTLVLFGNTQQYLDRLEAALIKGLS